MIRRHPWRSWAQPGAPRHLRQVNQFPFLPQRVSLGFCRSWWRESRLTQGERRRTPWRQHRETGRGADGEGRGQAAQSTGRSRLRVGTVRRGTSHHGGHVCGKSWRISHLANGRLMRKKQREQRQGSGETLGPNETQNSERKAYCEARGVFRGRRGVTRRPDQTLSLPNQPL